MEIPFISGVTGILGRALDALRSQRQSARQAARTLSDATRELQWAAWSFVSLHTQYGVARRVRDIADEERKILEKFGDTFRVFTQDYDLPADLAAFVKKEVDGINLAMLNLKAFAMTGQESEMTRTAQEIQAACERIREAARPYAYGWVRRLREKLQRPSVSV